MRLGQWVAVILCLFVGWSAWALEGTCQCSVSVISGATGLTISSGAVRGPCGRPISMANIVSPQAAPAATGKGVSQSSVVAAAAAAPTPAAVTVNNDFFDPTPLTISVGDTVTWTWAGGSLHSVTSVAGSIESFDSGDLSTGTFTHTFLHAGTYVYYCNIHGFDVGNGTALGMSATIKVNPVPEPAMGLLALPVLWGLGRRRRQLRSTQQHKEDSRMSPFCGC